MAHVLIIDERTRVGCCECENWEMAMPEEYDRWWRSCIEQAHRVHLRAVNGHRTVTTDLERFIREIKPTKD